ncbi:hypothetical protein [Schwartzia succinivorans]|jgi:hypothetical protein|uniref:Uncharacterized protein n=1 Tax=Schwartzia succinivorans DSM 10502 TaxID=1123243 RepID=A0A1M5B2D3_9FIRM|nr:hypothetical protein [Schwartzia succinivorans]SHF36507.1 hypothetical protein SAMN02745190_02495 [Schwartzia succinivorans DSM 10502]
MPDYVPTGRHVFSGRNRIDNEMVSLTPDPAIIAAPTEEELNIVPLEGHEVDDSDEIMEEEEFVDESQDDSFDGSQEDTTEETGQEYEPDSEDDTETAETPEEIAARLAGDRVKAQMDNLEIAEKIASEDTPKEASSSEETPEEIAARLAADRVHAQEMNLEVARSQQE